MISFDSYNRRFSLCTDETTERPKRGCWYQGATTFLKPLVQVGLELSDGPTVNAKERKSKSYNFTNADTNHLD